MLYLHYGEGNVVELDIPDDHKDSIEAVMYVLDESCGNMLNYPAIFTQEEEDEFNKNGG